MILDFLLGIMIVAFIAAGVYFFWYRKICFENETGNTFVDQLYQLGKAEPGELEAKINSIESKVEAIYVLVSKLNKKVAGIEKEIDCLVNSQDKNGSGEDINPKYIEIYKAYDNGEEISEIARAAGRNKGEIELILNLRKLKK